MRGKRTALGAARAAAVPSQFWPKTRTAEREPSWPIPVDEAKAAFRAASVNTRDR
jgi:hypothetical protein